MGIRADLITTIQQFNTAHNGQEPTKFHLTREDERALANMSRDEAGGSLSKNVRQDYRTLFGIEVVWDAPMRRCE